MNTIAAHRPIFANFPVRRLAAANAALLLAAALFLTACGGDAPALPPPDSSAPAGTALPTDFINTGNQNQTTGANR